MRMDKNSSVGKFEGNLCLPAKEQCYLHWRASWNTSCIDWILQWYSSSATTLSRLWKWQHFQPTSCRLVLFFLYQHKYLYILVYHQLGSWINFIIENFLDFFLFIYSTIIRRGGLLYILLFESITVLFSTPLIIIFF